MSNFYSSTSNSNAESSVIALDSRVSSSPQEQQSALLSKLRLGELLSRSLNLRDILETFSLEIQTALPHSGYRYQHHEDRFNVTLGSLASNEIRYGLSIQNQSLGDLMLYREERFSANELALFEELLCALLFPLRNALMYEKAMYSAHIDALTGLSNRSAMDGQLPREIHLAQRHQQEVVLMVLDLDGFKTVNDQCGHDVGDRVLRNAAKVMQQAMRATDLLYRYGGDEFVAALPQTTVEGALDVAQRIRQGVEKLELVECGSRRVGFSISIGVASLQVGEKFDDLFQRADQAMYHAKRTGKNRIEAA